MQRRVPVAVRLVYGDAVLHERTRRLRSSLKRHPVGGVVSILLSQAVVCAQRKEPVHSEMRAGKRRRHQRRLSRTGLALVERFGRQVVGEEAGVVVSCGPVQVRVGAR